jgi:hypothetical protein
MLNVLTLDTPLRPVAINVSSLSSGFSATLLNTTIPAGAPPGEYEIEVIFSDAVAPITGRSEAFLDISSTFTIQ